jgi:polar amino acid transport system substrate-binding protein
MDATYAPNEFVAANGSTIQGMDADLAKAIGSVMGLKVTLTNETFDGIIPGIQSGKYDVGMSSFTDTKEREKTVDFVTYFSAGFLWAAPKGKTVDPTNACGLTVAVQSDTTEQLEELPGLSKKCTSAGKKAIHIQSFTSQADATNAVVLGKADAMSADSPVTAYAIKQSDGKLVQAGDITEAAPYGWPIAKGSALVQAVQKAAQALMDDGTYDKICTKWGVQSGEIDTAEVNGAVS